MRLRHKREMKAGPRKRRPLLEQRCRVQMLNHTQAPCRKSLSRQCHHDSVKTVLLRSSGLHDSWALTLPHRMGRIQPLFLDWNGVVHRRLNHREDQRRPRNYRHTQPGQPPRNRPFASVLSQAVRPKCLDRRTGRHAEVGRSCSCRPGCASAP